MHRIRTEQDRNIFKLQIDTALQGITAAGAAVYLPIYLARIGAQPFDLALLTALPALLMVVLALPAGIFVDHQRNLVRTVLEIRFFYYLGPLAVALLLLTPLGAQAVLVVLTWAIFTAAWAAFPPAWMAAMPYIVPPERLLAVTGDRWAVQGVVMAAAAIGFGALLDHVESPISYQLVFLSSFVSGIAAIIVYSRIRIPSREPDKRMAAQATGDRLREMLRALVSNRLFVRLLFAVFIYQIATWLPEGLYSIFWVRELGASDTLIGIRTMAFNLALTLGYFAWGRLSGELGRGRVVVLCTLSLGLYPLLTALSPDAFWIVPVAAIRGLFFAGIDIVLFEALISKSPPQHRPGFIATSNLLDSVARLGAPLLGAALVSVWQIRGAILISTGLFIAAALLFWRQSFEAGREPVLSPAVE